MRSIVRHSGGDWGEVSDKERDDNDFALEYGGELRSLHIKAGCEQRFCVVTDQDRFATRVFILEED